MPFLSWREEYRVGVEQIDSEHRYLFDLINEFHDSHHTGADRRDLAKVLNSLVHYAEQHFRHEELIMQANGYPQFDAHKGLHEDLYMTIFKLADELGSGSLKVDMDTMRFVRSWLVDHIVKHDLEFADFNRRRQAKPQQGVA